MLSSKIRPQIAQAYLLARATDTIADTDSVPSETRTKTLTELRNAVLNIAPYHIDPVYLNPKMDAGERELLENIESVILGLKNFSPEDRQDISTVLDIITRGQLLDLERFVVNSQPNEVRSLAKETELDEYTYLVAGCVGEFWTKICRRHLYPQKEIDMRQFLELAIRFGKGLQMVNILRDLPADLKTGRCYMPTEILDNLGLSPESLKNAASYSKLESYYRSLLLRAIEHLEQGVLYIQKTPCQCSTWLMRLGCTWPILLGFRTLELLAETNPLDASQRVKVSRPEVKKILRKTVFLGFVPGGWNRMMRKYAAAAREKVRGRHGQ